MFLPAALLFTACAAPDTDADRLRAGQELHIFYDSGLDDPPMETRVVPCGFDLCLAATAETLQLVRVEDGWRGRMGGRPLALYDNGSGLWGAEPVSAIRLSWKVPVT